MGRINGAWLLSPGLVSSAYNDAASLSSLVLKLLCFCFLLIVVNCELFWSCEMRGMIKGVPPFLWVDRV